MSWFVWWFCCHDWSMWQLFRCHSWWLFWHLSTGNWLHLCPASWHCIRSVSPQIHLFIQSQSQHYTQANRQRTFQEHSDMDVLHCAFFVWSARYNIKRLHTRRTEEDFCTLWHQSRSANYFFITNINLNSKKSQSSKQSLIQSQSQ